jgi:hypothetical protein
VVIEVDPGGSDVIDVLAELNRNPERVYQIGRRNAVEALLRHDWVYRWKQAFDVAGLSPSPGMSAREDHLRDLAALADRSAEPGCPAA